MKTVKLLRTEIAWPSDKQIKFRNPEGYNLSYGEFDIQSCSQVCISQIHLTHNYYFDKCHALHCTSLAYLQL